MRFKTAEAVAAQSFRDSLQSVNEIPERVKITPLRPGAGRCLAALGDSKTPPESQSHNQPTKRVKTNCFKKLQNSTTAPCLQPCKALRGSSLPPLQYPLGQPEARGAVADAKSQILSIERSKKCCITITKSTPRRQRSAARTRPTSRLEG